MCGGGESLLKAHQKKTLRRSVAEITILRGIFPCFFEVFFLFLG